MEKDKTTSTEQLKEWLTKYENGITIPKFLSLAPTLAKEVLELREQLENRKEFEKQETEALRLLNYVRSENKVLREALIIIADCKDVPKFDGHDAKGFTVIAAQALEKTAALNPTTKD